MIAPTVLVLGGGRSALEAAQEVVAQGGRAVLIMPAGTRKACALRAPSGIETINDAELVTLDGSPGRFTAHLRSDGDEFAIDGDAVILADDPPRREHKVGRAIDLEEALAGELPGPLASVAMVLGPVASRAAHVRSFELALRLRSRPDRPEVTMFTKEVVAPGYDEITYARAQRAGVRVVRTMASPSIESEHALRVSASDHPSGLEVEVSPDLLVVEGLVSEPAGPSARTTEVVGNVSMGPISSLREGVFLCRPGERDLLDAELLTEARAAATRAMSLAMRPTARSPQAARVDRDKCSACLTCVRSCPFHAPRIDAEGKAAVDGDLCQACGICVAGCPSRALSLPSDQGMEERMSTMFKERSP